MAPQGTERCSVKAVNYDVRVYADDDNERMKTGTRKWLEVNAIKKPLNGALLVVNHCVLHILWGDRVDHQLIISESNGLSIFRVNQLLGKC